MKHTIISQQEMQRLNDTFCYISHFSVQQVEQGYEVTYERQKLGKKIFFIYLPNLQHTGLIS